MCSVYGGRSNWWQCTLKQTATLQFPILFFGVFFHAIASSVIQTFLFFLDREVSQTEPLQLACNSKTVQWLNCSNPSLQLWPELEPGSLCLTVWRLHRCLEYLFSHRAVCCGEPNAHLLPTTWPIRCYRRDEWPAIELNEPLHASTLTDYLWKTKSPSPLSWSGQWVYVWACACVHISSSWMIVGGIGRESACLACSQFAITSSQKSCFCVWPRAPAVTDVVCQLWEDGVRRGGLH